MYMKCQRKVISIQLQLMYQEDYQMTTQRFVFDCTKAPYKIVAKYRDNEIKPLVFPSIIERVAKHYNKAYCLVEINDLGQQVADNYNLN